MTRWPDHSNEFDLNNGKRLRYLTRVESLPLGG